MRRLDKQNIRKLQKTSGSYYVSIPIFMVRAMKLKEKEKVVVAYDKKGKRIIIKDWKK